MTKQRDSKHKTFVKHLYNVGPTSKTLGRRCINVIQMFCVCWDRLGLVTVIGPSKFLKCTLIIIVEILNWSSNMLSYHCHNVSRVMIHDVAYM